jgi:cysteine desulfurase
MKYFDYAATSPLDPDAANVYLKASGDFFGNTGSLHDTGSRAASLLESCRAQLALMLGAEKEGIYFTSGGSEGNFLAIHALLSAAEKKGKHIIAGKAEHSSVHSTLRRLMEDGFDITFLPFDEKGRIRISDFEAAIRKDTALAVIQHSNSEIGTIQPLMEISALCRKNEILLHSDMVHSFGKMDLAGILDHADSLSISAHKFYGPKGVGAVYVRPALSWKPYYPGSSHEDGFRPGTVNVPAIAAMLEAAGKAYSSLADLSVLAARQREEFLGVMKEADLPITVYGSDFSGEQLASTVGLGIRGIEGQWMMLECNRRGFAISTGSACQTGMQNPSKAMKAMGMEDAAAKEFIRISFGRDSALEEISELGCTIAGIVRDYSRHKPAAD